MVDAIFEHPRLVGVYDALDPDRSDLAVYLDIVDELGARSVLDLGCGTGTFALLLADRGVEVIGVDPAAGSLAVARAKRGAERVRWMHGDATSLPRVRFDLATMTGNVVQALVDLRDWEGTLRGVYAALRPGGCLVFETRDPAHRAWREWNRAASYGVTVIPGVGSVENWVEVTDISGSLVTFCVTLVFASDGQVLTSESTLRFRERDEVEAKLVAHGFALDDVRDAPDRPGREFVFFARRPGDDVPAARVAMTYGALICAFRAARNSTFYERPGRAAGRATIGGEDRRGRRRCQAEVASFGAPDHATENQPARSSSLAGQ